MRWEQLFSDLEAQFAAEGRRERDAEVADRTRRERAAVGLGERLTGHLGEQLGVRLTTGAALSGELVDLGAGWVLLAESPRRAALVPVPAIVAVTGLGTKAEAAALGRRFGLGYALRGLSRDRAAVRVTDVSGASVTGTIDAVGADALDLSEHALDAARREHNVLARRVLPFAALACVQSA